MGTQGTKTEHAGHKGSGRKSGFWGLRAEAKYNSKHRRRTMDKIAVREELDMITHADILKLYREYVNECIENTSDENPINPMPFVTWKKKFMTQWKKE